MSGNPTRMQSGFISKIGVEELPIAATPSFASRDREARWARQMERNIAEVLENLEDLEDEDLAIAV